MPVDHIRYDILAQEALRGLVRRLLGDIARDGLPGEHHFYITFDTTADGVRLSQRLREQYPQEMTIVLQHQFWDLKVGDEAFEVGLSFSGVTERLRIPYEAITEFRDPSVQFGLQFQALIAEAEEPEPVPMPAAKPSKARSPARPESARGGLPAASPAADKPLPAPAASEPNKGGGAEVVRLDRFRKK